MNIDLNTPSFNLEPISVVDYPHAGTGEFVGCAPASPVSFTHTVAVNAGSSSSSSGIASYLRVNSFSACKLSNNTALIAVASQKLGVEKLQPTEDVAELSRRASSRVHILSAPLGEKYAAAVRCGTIVSVEEEPISDCAVGIINLRVNVGETIWGDEELDSLWVLDGELTGLKFRIIGRTAPDLWKIVPADNTLTIDFNVGAFVHFIAYGGKDYEYPNSLNTISPLPYIEVDGLAVPATNPQIASNPFDAPSLSPYVYVIAEAPVDGVYQLFFYSFKVGTDYEVFGWRQLTFDGENRNARVKADKNGNVHVLWESSRCKPNQIYYGVVGPNSREMTNDAFASAIDKQIAAGTESDLQSLLTFGSATGLTLGAWSSLTASGGTTSAPNSTTVTSTGNPRTQKFASFVALNKDENNVTFDGKFSQLSYQVGFNLTLTATTQNWSASDVQTQYATWKASFVPHVANSTNGVNVYLNGGNYYTLDDPQTVYENIIPIQGAYKNNGAAQVALKHYMLVAIPEKVRFTAKSTANLADIRSEYYTGKFKLGLVFETSENVSSPDIAQRKHHWVREFGDLMSFNSNYSYTVAVHYSHLREEAVHFRSDNYTPDNDDQGVRFAGNVIVAVGGVAKVAETFVADFSDQYRQFDLGFGCATVGEFRTLSLSAFDGTTNDNISVTESFTGITVGPHSVKGNQYLTHFAKSDRNVDRMVVLTDANELDSLSAAEEAWVTDDEYLGPDFSEYWLSLGLNRGKFGLSQIPITFEGSNTAPNVSLDSCGRPHVAFQSNRNGGWEIYYTSAVDAGMPFRFDTRITNSESNSLSPSIAVDGEGRRLIAWHDDRSGQYQVFAARSTESIFCYDDICAKSLGVAPQTTGLQVTSEYDPYIEDPYYASICQVNFVFKNESASTRKYHFRANFYSDASFTSFYKEIDSRQNVSGWYANGVQMPFDGVSVTAGATVEVTYEPSTEDAIFGELYYIELEADWGADIKPLETTLVYFCSSDQTPRCTIPSVYTNSAGSSKVVHFRTTVYRDSALTQSVLAANTQTDVTRWIAGSTAFPTGGITVAAGSTISVVYNPEFTSLDQSESRDGSVIKSLMCGVTYWVVTEAYYDAGYNALDSFAIMCSCEGMKTHIWRTDTQAAGWVCSGQGGQDTRITATNSHALFPHCDASADGVIYIAWEDRRLSQTTANNHYVYYGIWDARTDIFYSSAQGFRDREVATYSRFRPIVIVNNMQHANFLFSDGNKMYTRTCSLYRQQQFSSSSSSYTGYGKDGVFNEKLLPMSSSDYACLGLSVYAEDARDYYHKTGSVPIALVDECKIRMEVAGPPGSYAVRFRNDGESNFSEWLNILPKLPAYPSSSSAGTSERGYLDGFFVGNDKFIVPWVLSRGSGSKTVSAQVLTPHGMTQIFSVDIVARYKELKHKIEFFRDSTLTTAASVYKGKPVVSTKVLTVKADDATSIASPAAVNNNIYVKVTFDDPKRLETLLDAGKLRKYGGDGLLTFDVYTQGFNRFDLPLIRLSSGVYTGSFIINKDDGIENKDGEATVVVNIPAPCFSMRSSSSATCIATLVKPTDIRLQRAAEVDNAAVTLEKFKVRYDKDVLCGFTSNQCVDGTETYATDESDDDNEANRPTPTGTPSCEEFSWTSTRKGEKGYFLPSGGANAADWVVESPTFEIDFNDPRIDYIKFGVDSELDDMLFMVRVGETIVATETSSGESVGEDGNGGLAAKDVKLSVPQGSVLFAANRGYYCHKPSKCSNGSAAKEFYVGDFKFGDVPAGTTANDGTGDIEENFAEGSPEIPWANGYNDGSPGATATNHYTNMLKTTLEISVSKNELATRGFITGNNKLRFKLVHVPSGVGHAKIVGMTCGSACLTSSSSSSAA